MRIDKRALDVSRKQSKLQLLIIEYREEHELTVIETMQALTECLSSMLKYQLRYERHGNYDTPAMLPPEGD